MPEPIVTQEQANLLKGTPNIITSPNAYRRAILKLALMHPDRSLNDLAEKIRVPIELIKRRCFPSE